MRTAPSHTLRHHDNRKRKQTTQRRGEQNYNLQSIMASPCKVPNQSERSGKKTLEYRKVQANLENTIATLESNRDAKNVLCQKFIQKGWTDARHKTPTDNELMVLVLNRIELSADTYSEFIEMLGNIPGLDLIKKRIDTTTVAFQEQEPPKQGSAAMVASVGQPFSSVQTSKGYTGGQGPLISGKGGHVKPESNTRDDSGLASTTIGYDSESYYNNASSVESCADNHEATLLSDDSVPQELSTSFDGVTQHQSSSDFPTGAEEQHCHGNESVVVEEATSMNTDDPDHELDSTDSESELVGQLKEVTLKVAETEESHRRLKVQIKEKNDTIRKLQNEKGEIEKRYQEEIKRLEEKAKADEIDLEKMKTHSAHLEKRLQEKEKESENLRMSLRQFEESAERRYLNSECYDVLQKQIKKLTEQLKKEKVKNDKMEREILHLKNKLLKKELELKEKDNDYKDKVRAVERERDEAKVKLANAKREQEEEKRRKMEEENQKLLEELKLLRGQKKN